MVEAVIVSAVRTPIGVLGGGLGIAVGYWLAPLLTQLFQFPTLISQASVILAFTVSAFIAGSKRSRSLSCSARHSARSRAQTPAGSKVCSSACMRRWTSTGWSMN